MSRRPQHREQEEEPSMNIDSLVDVAFLLLIYFLVTTSLQKLEADLTINPPGPPNPNSTELPEIPPITILIAANGDITATTDGGTPELLDRGNDSRDLELLRNKFNLYASSAQGDMDQALVIIQPESAANHQRFVDVINAAVEAKLENISFTLFEEEEA